MLHATNLATQTGAFTIDEEALAHLSHKIGSVVAIGQPANRWQIPGAPRKIPDQVRLFLLDGPREVGAFAGAKCLLLVSPSDCPDHDAKSMQA